MKVLGRIHGNEVVLSNEDGFSAITLVDRIPSIRSTKYGSIQLAKSVGEYKAGDILLNNGTEWVKLTSPRDTIGAVSTIIRPRLGRVVQIRWSDPSDKEKYVWKHTVLLRKYGEYPKNPLDGVLVVDSYVRDYYRSHVLTDTLPAGTEDNWFYKFYTFSEDEVGFSSEACEFQPIELTWEKLPEIVRAGQADNVYGLGDVVTVEFTNAHEHETFTVDFEVAGFDCVKPEEIGLTKSITFVSVNAFCNHSTKFDEPWPRFFLTADRYVTSTTKVYYIKTPEEAYVQATNLRLGQRIPADTYYEENTNTDRLNHGGNRWASSTLRTWLNSTNPDAAWTMVDGYRMQPPLVMMQDDVKAVISSVRNITNKPLSDGAGYDLSIDKISIPSRTEIYGTVDGFNFYEPTRDRYPLEEYVETLDLVPIEGKTYFLIVDGRYVVAGENSFDEDGLFIEGQTYYERQLKDYYIYDETALESYRPAEKEDFTEGMQFKPDVTYYEQMVDAMLENSQLPQFRDTELTPRIKKNKDGGISKVKWWSRSAVRTTDKEVWNCNEEGDMIQGVADDTDKYLVISFTVA